jgi:hypothetical protein
LNDTRGYNTALVDESGLLTPELFVTKLRAYGAINREVLIDMTADAKNWIRDDSQVALLVSLLSTAYTLKYKESQKETAPAGYNDGHISADLVEIMDIPVGATDWRADDDLVVSFWDQRVMTTMPTVPTINCAGMSLREVAILLQHLNGRVKTTPLAFDITIERLTSAVKIAGQKHVDEHTAPDGTTSAQVIKTLNKYVIVNRLYGAFEAALGIYHQTALTPIPDTAEGLLWLKRKRSVILPRFDAMRGMFSVLMLEEAFGISANVTHSWKWWLNTGLASATTAAPYNAISLWGRYLVEGGFYDKDADVYQIGSFNFAQAPGAAYYAFASLLTGGDVYCAVPPTYGMAYEPWDPDADNRIPVTVHDLAMTGYDIVTSHGTSTLKVKHVPQPCTATTIIGRCARNGSFTALSDRFEIPISRVSDAWVVPNVDKAWCFGMVSRWLGYDTVMRYNGVQRIANWASNASSIAVRPFYVDGRDARTVDIISVTERTHWFDTLPALGNKDTVWTVEIDVTDKFAILSVSGNTIAVDGAFHGKLGKDVQVVVPSIEASMFTPLILRARQPASAYEAGFQIVDQHTTHEPPKIVAHAGGFDVPPDDPQPGEDGRGAVLVG